MDIDRRRLMAAGAGLGLTGAGGAQAMAGPRTPPHLGNATLSLETGTERPQTEAIQKAINDSAQSGAPVILPPGRFVCGELTLSTSTSIIGAHGATQLVARDAGALISARSASRVRLEGLTMDGGGFAEHLVRLEDCGGIITDCRLKGARESALFATDSSGLVISFNEVSACSNNGVLVWRSTNGSDGTQIVCNRIVDIRAIGGGSGQNGNAINIFRAGDVVVSGNTIRRCAFSAIRGNAASNLQVTGNNCRDLGEVAIYAEFGFEGAVISQNIVDGAATGIAVTNFNEGGRLASVQGNLVRNLKRRTTTGPDQRGDGITVEADSVVNGNVVEAAQSNGIAIGWGPYMRSVVASANVIRDAGVGIAITADQTAGACLVTGNMIAGTTRGAIRAFDHHKPVGGELALEETATARVRITGNVAV